VLPGAGHNPLDRIADLSELICGLYAVHHLGYPHDTVFIRCFEASGRRVNEAGTDVLAVQLRRLTLEPLQPDERLNIGEAKHSLSSDPARLPAAMMTDVSKTGNERLRDMLQLAVTHLDTFTDHPYPERVNQFMEANAEMMLTGLMDPLLVSAAAVRQRALARMQELATPGGVPVTAVLIAEIPNLSQWITTTL
jgi:hypothetical protein